jgi:methyltransferase (TIGR00027 family)
MRGETEYSRTAEVVALARALEQAKPAASRILDDPYAAAFLQHRSFRLIAHSRWLSRGLSLFIRYWAPGGQELLTLRARLVDDLAAEMAMAGLEQVVLLGAGFDTMPLRLAERLREVAVFEIDHPATQAVKRASLARLAVPDHVRFVAADFERDDFVEKLRGAGFSPQRRSLVVWVGVSYYLTAQAMARARAQIATLGGAGTRLIFDYILAEVIHGTSRDRDALGKARRVAQLGEPWLFGLEPAQVKDYLAVFGFRLLKDYAPEELRARYCPQGRRPASYVRIAVCERV